jgi:hypothetical protein
MARGMFVESRCVGNEKKAKDHGSGRRFDGAAGSVYHLNGRARRKAHRKGTGERASVV